MSPSSRIFAITALASAGTGAVVYALHVWSSRRSRAAVARVLEAAVYSAHQHRDQRRKNKIAEPYINHPLRIARMLAAEGASEHTVIAALLHDTVEDTDSTIDEIRVLFNPSIASIVADVTDDKSLPKAERKRLQIEHAPSISREAKLVKLADKIDNTNDLLRFPPVGWTAERVREYFAWSEAVVAGLRGTNSNLERTFDSIILQCDSAVDKAAKQLAEM